MKLVLILTITVGLIISIAAGILSSPIIAEKTDSGVDEQMNSIPDAISGMQKQLEDVNQAIEQIENANPELRQIDDFTLCAHVSSMGAQYYFDMYASEPKYREWFNDRFPDTTINQVLDNIEDRKQFYQKLGKSCGN